MQARMPNPVVILPAAMQALQALHESAQTSSIPKLTHHLIHLRASQINGCSFCVEMHPRLAKQDGETDQRLFAVAAWRDAPFFTDAERAALALTEAVTHLDSKGVSDEVWQDARKHFGEEAIAALLVSISSINVWNRLNVSVRNVAGASW
jgi:AhpD family alkylhydroperoxidase